MEMESKSNILMGTSRGKRSKPPRTGCFGREDEHYFYEDIDEMAAHSLVLLSHSSSSVESFLPRPSKRVMKVAKEFHFTDSPYHCDKRSWYKCKTCSKKFLSFQALGGHRASCCHTTTLAHHMTGESEQVKEKNSCISNKMKVHECPICYRVFNSGQALGGHKRTHSTTLPPTLSSATTENEYEKRAELDLNMPAPLEMEDASILSISHYDKYNLSLHCWMDSYGKRVESDYDGLVAGKAERGMGGDIGFKRDILLVTTVT